MNGVVDKKIENETDTSLVKLNGSVQHTSDELYFIGKHFSTFVELYKKQNKAKKKTEKRERDVEIMHFKVFDKKQKSKCERHISDVLTAGGEIAGVNTVGDEIVYTLINYIDDE